MSRIARKPLHIPSGVTVKQTGNVLHIKGQKGALDFAVSDDLAITLTEHELNVAAKKPKPLANVRAMVGTTRVLLENAVNGLHTGFERKLILKGVGYRAKAQGKVLELSLGFSHPVKYNAPEGITIETPSNTEVVIKGTDKQVVGQTAAEIRRFRPPESYKGKGVRYDNEDVVIKETKKK